jgi:AAA+ superfamily predicted ATPase
VKFSSLIGPAKRIEAAMHRKLQRPDFRQSGPHKLLFYGPPGTGKSVLAHSMAMEIDPAGRNTLKVNGKEVTVDVVRGWRNTMHTQPLDRGCWVTLIDELDLASNDAQNLMLSWLDAMPWFSVVLATSNQEIGSLQERLHTRFQAIEFGVPSAADIYAGLVGYGIPEAPARQIAEGCDGNVRSAEMDATSWEDFNA